VIDIRNLVRSSKSASSPAVISDWAKLMKKGKERNGIRSDL
jgi:hypothetical protein